MRRSRVFLSLPIATGRIVDLPSEQANYVGKVLRLRVGSELSVFDGQGNEFLATVQQVERRKVTINIGDRLRAVPESPLQIHLGQVISRGDRMDYAVQKSVELGVTSITPLFSDRCEVKLDPDRSQRRTAHWQQVAISACEQSGRARLPIVHPASHIASWLEKAVPSLKPEIKLVLHPEQQGDNRSMELSVPPKQAVVLIGPEGGFSSEEVALAIQQGFQCLTLGPRILRTETAPVVALTVLQSLWGDIQTGELTRRFPSQ